MWNAIRTFGATAVLLVFTRLSQATIIPALDSGPSPNGMGGFSFNYRADVGPHSDVGPGFFTIYGIPDFQSAAATAPGWSFTLQFVGITPSSINSNVILANVVFYYTGPAVDSSGSTVSFQGFTINSGVGDIDNGTFASGRSPSSDITTGPILTPGLPLIEESQSSLPEPASMLLIGSGLVVLAIARRTRSRR